MINDPLDNDDDAPTEPTIDEMIAAEVVDVEAAMDLQYCERKSAYNLLARKPRDFGTYTLPWSIP